MLHAGVGWMWTGHTSVCLPCKTVLPLSLSSVSIRSLHHTHSTFVDPPDASTMALCPAEGRPDMYGLGIRLAFYIDWFSVALIEYIHEQDLADVRLLGFLLSLAVTISIIVQIVNNDLDPIDINIALILTMGIYVLLTPLYLWRFMTCFNQYLDPLRFSKEEPPPPVFRLMRFLLLIVNAGIGTWFFTTYLAESNLGCDQYAFFLSRMNIDSTVYIAFGAMFFIIVILACICVLFVKSGWITGFEGQERPGRAMRCVQCTHGEHDAYSRTQANSWHCPYRVPSAWNPDSHRPPDPRH